MLLTIGIVTCWQKFVRNYWKKKESKKSKTCESDRNMNQSICNGRLKTRNDEVFFLFTVVSDLFVWVAAGDASARRGCGSAAAHRWGVSAGLELVLLRRRRQRRGRSLVLLTSPSRSSRDVRLLKSVHTPGRDKTTDRLYDAFIRWLTQLYFWLGVICRESCCAGDCVSARPLRGAEVKLPMGNWKLHRRRGGRPQSGPDPHDGMHTHDPEVLQGNTAPFFTKNLFHDAFRSWNVKRDVC